MSFRKFFGSWSVAFAVAAVVVGCAAPDVAQESETDTEGAADQVDEAVISVETDTTSTAATTCPPPATCTKAFQSCPNPRLGGAYCDIANRCITCRL